MSAFRPADVCRALLAALEASEGRRKKRKRDQTPDAIGLGVKHAILERVVQDNPDAEAFEGWLLQYCERTEGSHSGGAVAAMARAVLEEWQLAHSMGDFKSWLDRGAPSDDAEATRAGQAANVSEPETRNSELETATRQGGPMPSDEVRRLLKTFGVAVTEFEDAVHQGVAAAELRKRDAEVRACFEEVEALIERLRRRAAES